jgi:hypothetical protein
VTAKVFNYVVIIYVFGFLRTLADFSGTDLSVDVRFEVFMAVTMKKAVFWDVAPCRCGVNRRFGGT